MKTIIGIDPGKNGSIVVLHNQVVDIFSTDIDDIKACLDDNEGLLEVKVYIEQVHASQQMGVSSAFNFGVEYGRLIGAFEASTFAVIYVTPQKWQAALNCRTGSDKNVTKNLAKKLFPDIKVTHKNADALLIAYYGMLKENGNV